MKINIKSDGTPEGTSIVLDGVDVTQESQVESVNFSANSWADNVYFNWSTIEKDANGVSKRVSYTYSPNEPALKRTYIGKPVTNDAVAIGKKNPIIFDTKEDETNFQVLKTVPKLADRVKIVDTTISVADEKK